MDRFIIWKDKVIGKYCITPIKGEEEEIGKLINWLKKEMAGFSYPRLVDNLVKTYRGKPVEYIHKLELIECYESGKNIHSFYYDKI